MGDILVLDDVADAGLMLKRLLERKGHRVSIFTEEDEALAHIRVHPVEGLIGKMSLPFMTEQAQIICIFIRLPKKMASLFILPGGIILMKKHPLRQKQLP